MTISNSPHGVVTAATLRPQSTYFYGRSRVLLDVLPMMGLGLLGGSGVAASFMGMIPSLPLTREVFVWGWSTIILSSTVTLHSLQMLNMYAPGSKAGKVFLLAYTVSTISILVIFGNLLTILASNIVYTQSS